MYEHFNSTKMYSSYGKLIKGWTKKARFYSQLYCKFDNYFVELIPL